MSRQQPGMLRGPQVAGRGSQVAKGGKQEQSCAPLSRQQPAVGSR